MMAEVLELRDGCTEHPTRWDLAIVEARMLWPHDPDRRARYLNAVAIKLNLEQLDRFPVPMPSPSEVKELASAMHEAPRVSDFEEDSKRAFVHGTVAGKVLRDAVGYHLVDPAEAGLTRAKERAAARVWPEFRVSTKNIDNVVWPRYRPVAHLWAAYAHRTVETDDDMFPCHLADLGIFLAVAERYRERGETIRPSPKAPAKLLRAGKAVELPAGIRLPAVEIRFKSSGR